MRRRFVQVDAGYSAGLKWREIDTAFESRIMTDAIINFKHIEPRQLLEDMWEIVLERVRTVLTKYDNIKLYKLVNTVFNGEFVASDKRANKVSLQETMNSFEHPICKSGMSRALSSLF